MQQRFGIAIRLRPALEHQIARRLKRQTLVKIWCHLAIGRVSLVLLIDNPGHAFKACAHLIFGDDAVMQPIGKMLALDTQGRTIFHQANIVNIRHFGTTNPLVDPTHDIA